MEKAFNFSRINEYPLLAIAMKVITEKGTLTLDQERNLLVAMVPDARVAYVGNSLIEVAKVLHNVVILLSSNADIEADSNEIIFECVKEDFERWYRKLVEGLIEIANFENSNEEIYYRHLIQLREFCTIKNTLSDEKTYFACDNKNKQELCRVLYESIEKSETQLDLSKCWYLKRSSRLPIKDRSDGASLNQFSSFDERLRKTLNALSSGEKIIIGFSNNGYRNASTTIHWSVGSPDSFQQSPKEAKIKAGIYQISMLALAMITRLHRLTGSDSETIRNVAGVLHENELAKQLLHDGTNRSIEAGDYVSVPYGNATVVKSYRSEYGYYSYEVIYVSEPPIPSILRDHFPAHHVKLILKKDEVVAKLTEQFRPLFEQVFMGLNIPDDELRDVMSQALGSTISKSNKESQEDIVERYRKMRIKMTQDSSQSAPSSFKPNSRSTSEDVPPSQAEGSRAS